VFLLLANLELSGSVNLLKIKLSHISQQILINDFVPELLVAEMIQFEAGSNCVSPVNFCVERIAGLFFEDLLVSCEIFCLRGGRF
jgi:hypothetical protein